MTGGARSRHCAQCRLNVFNLSGLSRVEAEALLVAKEGKVCVRYFRRPDGTVLTRDCEGGFKKNFYAQFNSFERTMWWSTVSAGVMAFSFATTVTIFGDNIKALFSTQVVGLAGENSVSRPTKQVKVGTLKTFGAEP